MEATNAITPPNLLGIERRIAYANKKYHSGWICIGVLSGFAGMKLSGSPNLQGNRRETVRKGANIKIIPNISFTVKYGWN